MVSYIICCMPSLLSWLLHHQYHHDSHTINTIMDCIPYWLEYYQYMCGLHNINTITSCMASKPACITYHRYINDLPTNMLLIDQLSLLYASSFLFRLFNYVFLWSNCVFLKASSSVFSVERDVGVAVVQKQHLL